MYVKDLNESARAKLDSVLADGYTVDEYGLISSPGKFEAEPFATPILWQMGLEGFSDIDESDEYQNLYEFAMTPAELADYGLDYGFGTKPLNGTHFYVHLSESDQGLVSLNVMQQSLDEMNGDYDDDPTPEPEPVQKRRKARKPHEIEGLLISETFINLDKGYRFGESEPYEPFTENVGKLFRSLQREYGRCTGKQYIDTSSGTKAIGWIFEKRMQYDDARSKNDTYTREVWVTLHTGKPTRSTAYQYATLD